MKIIFHFLLFFWFFIGCKIETKTSSTLPAELLNKLNHAKCFNDMFDMVDSIKLETGKDHPIGQVKTIKFFNTESFLICDDIGHNLLLFTKKGKLMKSISNIGKGPGEFIKLTDAAIDSQGNIFVLDYSLSRVSKFDSQGNFKNSFSVSPFAYFILSQKNGNILLYYAAAMPMPDYRMFQQYNQAGEAIGKFGERPQNAIIDGLPIVGGSFFEDSLGNVFSVHISEYKIYKFKYNGELLSTFGRSNAPFYTPIKSPLLPYDTTQVNSFTSVSRIFVTSTGIVLVFFKKQKPAKQWIEIYDGEGNFIVGNIEVPSELLLPKGIHNDVFYFEYNYETIMDSYNDISSPKFYGYKLKY